MRFITKIIKEWKNEAGVMEPVSYKIKHEANKTYIDIYSNRPGLLIGRAGVLVDKYREKIKSCYPAEIRLYEVDWIVK